MSIQEMRNELIHYIHSDIDNYSDSQIEEMFNNLFGGLYEGV